MKKICILFGGKSPEHEVSIKSAINVLNAIDKSIFEITNIYVGKLGAFYKVENINKTEDLNSLETFDINNFKDFDKVFPVMHGPNCEDGKMQGFFETLGVAYVGPNVLSSAISMDKDIQKQIARLNNIKVTNWLAVKKFEFNKKYFEELKNKINKELSYPVFVKPANMGSSVGIVKVENEDELFNIIEQTFLYDKKIIIEEAVVGREIEVAVLGKENNLKISNPGEIKIIGGHDFYDYDAKYLDENGSKTFIPAESISEEKILEIKEISKKIYNLLECKDLSRIDFLLKENGEIVLNEVNTMPGFTNISMYPKLMEEMGINYTQLISELLLAE